MVFDPNKKVVIITHPIKTVLWCDFNHDNHSPEFIGKHPAVVVSYPNGSYLPYLVVPATSKMPTDKIEFCHRLETDIIFNGKDTWIVCSHIYAVAKNRIHGFRTPRKVAQNDFDQIVAKLHLRLPKIPET